MSRIPNVKRDEQAYSHRKSGGRAVDHNGTSKKVEERQW